MAREQSHESLTWPPQVRDLHVLLGLLAGASWWPSAVVRSCSTLPCSTNAELGLHAYQQRMSYGPLSCRCALAKEAQTGAANDQDAHVHCTAAGEWDQWCAGSATSKECQKQRALVFDDVISNSDGH
jgi:hypothetical protein